ncbi:DUF4190 domain-containing protein [Mycolicibacterium vinylchloridicum]|uniref:DUF4190 domain-containing protein n=1 Tax=Mycolicibacterium vinylchloridicum TaxID=2736928 RepID=UPI0015CCDA70|nr:DUF4190 domain-containing protein [Mycolicibacterium vinylchloridicum]
MTDQDPNSVEGQGPALPPSRFGAGFTVGGHAEEPPPAYPAASYGTSYPPAPAYGSPNIGYPPPSAPEPGGALRYPDPVPQPVVYPPPVAVGYPVPVVVRGTNGMAVASFICSLLCMGILGIIFGHIAVSQINRTGEEGKGLAVAGLVIGYLSMAAVLLIYVVPLLFFAASRPY